MFTSWIAIYLLIGLGFGLLVLLASYMQKNKQYADLAWMFLPVAIAFWPLCLFGYLLNAIEIARRNE
jgi:hypothetical protein